MTPPKPPSLPRRDPVANAGEETASLPGSSDSADPTASTPRPQEQPSPTPRRAATVLKVGDAQSVAMPTGGIRPAPSELDGEIGDDAQLDRYRLVRVLDQGGMGLVYEAIDGHLERSVALKVVLKTGQPEVLRRFMTEARVTGRLEHPNIVPAHDLGVDSAGRTFFTMKLVRGETLRQRLQRWREEALTAAIVFEMLSIMLKVCDALAFAHSRGVLHRDIKPANIMIGEFGEVLVMDWGVARVDSPDEAERADEDPPDAENRGTRTRLTAYGSVVGTPRYMPPEQASGDADAVGPWSDVYSVGAVLYEMLAGSPVFEGGDSNQLLRDAVRGEIEPPDRRAPERGIPPELASVAMKALATAPADRYPSLSAMKRDLELFLEGRAVSAHANSPWRALVKLMRRNLPATITAAASAVLVIAIAGVAFVQVIGQRDIAVRALAETRQANAERELAERAARAAQDEQADRAMRRLRAFDPFSQAMDLLMRGQKADQAVALLRSAIAIDAAFPEATYALGQALEADGQEAAAARAYLDAEELSERVTGKPHLQSLLAAAFAFHNDGSYPEAEEAFRRVERLGADHPLALVGKAFRLANGGQSTEGREAAQRALALAPTLWETHYAYAQVLSVSILEGRLPVTPWRQTLIGEYRKALELTPRQPEVIRSLATELALVPGQQEAAARMLDDLVAALPKSGNTRLERAMMRAHAGDVAAAAADVDAARRLGASPMLLAYDGAAIAYEQNDFTEAFRLWGEAIALSPKWPPLLTSYLNVACQLGKFDEVKPTYEKWCRDNPTYPEVFLLQAQMAFVRHADDEALALTRTGLEFGPHHQNLIQVELMALMRLGRLDEAETVAERALADDPTDWTMTQIAATVLSRLGRRADCSAVIDRMEHDHPEQRAEAEALRAKLVPPAEKK